MILVRLRVRGNLIGYRYMGAKLGDKQNEGVKLGIQVIYGPILVEKRYLGLLYFGDQFSLTHL